MQTALLTALTMLAFAANSVLTRMAVRDYAVEPLQFAAIRLLAGAAILVVLVALRGGGLGLGRERLPGAAALLVYMLGFSLAYRGMDAGVGALILFGGVQLTMFAGAVLAREPVPALRWIGAVVALSGLAVLLLGPNPHRPDPQTALAAAPTAFMAAAALGWGVYSLIGRGAGDPLRATAASFLLASPVAVLAALAAGGPMPSVPGVVLALVSGSVTSGLGYALWYVVLPKLGRTRAAVAQLTVPVIALLAGAALLGERPGPEVVLATALVLGGVALSLMRRG